MENCRYHNYKIDWKYAFSIRILNWYLEYEQLVWSNES